MHYKRSVFRSLAMVSQLGFSVVTPVLLCIFAGYQLDTHFGIRTMIPLLILGVLAGGRCAWLLVQQTLAQEQKEEEQERLVRMQHSVHTGTSKPKEVSRIRDLTPAPPVDEKKERVDDGMAE